jgi:hypothetical protein
MNSEVILRNTADKVTMTQFITSIFVFIEALQNSRMQNHNKKTNQYHSTVCTIDEKW